ncbi:MAG: VWA domain-containing protein [Pseudomonadota bacterium]
MLSFAWPWIGLLLPLPWIVMRFDRWRSRQAGTALSVPPHMAEALQALAPAGVRVWRRESLPAWLAWILFLAALAQPSWIDGSEIRQASGRALILAIDLSGSMERQDFVLDGTRVNRLNAVKSVAMDFVSRRSGDRIGLVLFGDEAFTASPLTFDTAALAHAIAEAGIGMAGRTTAIGDALGLATIKLREDPAEQRAIVLLSDGTNNSGESEPEDAARLARDFGVRIHTIALGSTRAAPEGTTASRIDPSADLDEATLEEVARIADGRFFRASTTEDLTAVYGEISMLESAPSDAPPVVLRRDLRNVFLVMLLGVLIAYAAVPLFREAS